MPVTNLHGDSAGSCSKAKPAKNWVGELHWEDFRLSSIKCPDATTPSPSKIQRSPLSNLSHGVPLCHLHIEGVQGLIAVRACLCLLCLLNLGQLESNKDAFAKI